MSVDPSAPITDLSGVGPSLANKLAKLDIYRYLDLLLHLPFRYQDRSRVFSIAALRDGDEGFVEGTILGCRAVYGKRRSLEVTIRDDSGQLTLRFFYFSKHQQQQLAEATYVRAFGQARFIGKRLNIVHPDYQTFDTKPPPIQAELLPVYATTQGLNQKRLRALCGALSLLPWEDAPGLPFAALRYLHRPADLSQVEAIREQLALQELAAYYIIMKSRALQRRREHGQALVRKAGLGRELLNQLPFRLTQAQKRVIAEILNDLVGATPMLRLVQGDVGSGKTIVSAFAAIRAHEHAAQTALMAPTELLAEQHFLNFSQWLAPLGISVALLTGKMGAKERRATLANIECGETAIVIGTHALFQDTVQFNNLALVIIDEQHRFGVHQRMTLKDKGRAPHQLVMTATPIPRTLTMTLYADMDVSVIDELPQGRQPITTHTVANSRRADVLSQVLAALKRGEQAYWVCTLIEPSEDIVAAAALATFELLSEALPNLRIGLLHGRLDGDSKIATMRAFKAGELQLLVATTVIEVGVDVPNATQMVIENAERLGLAQLHQLRGRVGRGGIASHCYLLFESRLSQTAKKRLSALRTSQDGFYLAEQDLKLRGPGDILGTRQAGEESFRVADLGEDAHLMQEVVAYSEGLLAAPANSEERRELARLLSIWAPSDAALLSV